MAEKQKQLWKTGAKIRITAEKGYSPKEFPTSKGFLLKSPSVRSIHPAVTKEILFEDKGILQNLWKLVWIRSFPLPRQKQGILSSLIGMKMQKVPTRLWKNAVVS